jgi:hypothetical protein
MVDRTITYTQAVPRSEDFLKTQKFGMLGLGYLAQAVFGQPQQIFNNAVAWVDGIVCAPDSPPSLNVSVSEGSIYEMEEIDATSYGVLGVDTDTVLKQGLLTDPVLLTLTPPGTSGYSQYYIIQAIYNDVDGGPTVLPYYNADNPLIPLGGPANSGQQQYTIRQGVCAVALKAGVAAPTGTQTIPAADAGYTPLWSILVSNGQTQITSANIAQIKDATFISPKLTQIPPAIQAQKDNWAVDTGPSANVMQVSLPGWTNVIAGLTLRIIKKAPSNTATPTLSINGGAPISIAWADGNALQPGDWPAGAIGQITYNGSSWELYSIAGPSIFARVAPGTAPVVTDAALLHYGVDTGSANAAVCGSVTPAISTAISVGMAFEVQKTSNANSGSMTLSVTSTGGTTVAPLYWADGNALQANDWPASSVALCMFDGTYYRLLSVTHRPIIYPDGAYVHYGVSAGTNTLTLTSTPTFASMTDGIFLEMTPTAGNSGPVTLAANGLSPAPIQTITGNNLAAGQLQANQPVLLMALGGVWKMFAGGSGGGTLTNIQVFYSSGNYTPTMGAQKALAFVTGGGGGGGCAPQCGAGGGAGATCLALITLSGISSIPFTVGAGGAGANAPPTSGISAGGGWGGTSQLGSGGSIYAVAPGGSPAHANIPGYGGIQVAGGAQGLLCLAGGDGHAVVVPTGVYGNGNGGASFWGGGGFGGSGGASPGNAYGSGGGGYDSLNPQIGHGPGAPGIVVVFEF